MPESSNPVDNFLNAYFTVRNNKAEQQQRQQAQQLAQNKFMAEQANHAADMSQRTDQFKQEMAQRDKQYAFQNALAGNKEQQDFRDKGGQLPPTPDPNKTQTT